ncbi:PREDICTED: FAS-associated death domain protein-like [Cyprinodon variegatus]|uniref:FAS-associated death domain protein-like n=1 Tax=Cyprinodon variegatus TaxID=28743 RepID=A0A3Q2CZW9_CYPVA|nr:PREDICTED: FAS-associated death domain protein-like [Cyprinodon variegatus]
MSASSLNSVLLDISNQLHEDNLEKLKFLLRDVIKKQKMEKIHSGHQLFEAMAERGQLGSDRTDFLSNLLKEIHREDLSEQLDRLKVRTEVPSGGLTDSERAKLDAATQVISQNLGKNWRKLGRKLGLSEAKLESIALRHPTDLEETAMELLKEWRKSGGAGAPTDELLAALRGVQLNLTADKIQDKLRQEGLMAAD